MSALRKSLLTKGPKRFSSGSNDFTPVPWSKYFESEFEVDTDSGVFHLYKKGDSGPILLCLHGGGYNSLTWALFTAEIIDKIDCQVLAIDLRGHGSSIATDDSDLSLVTMSSDVCQVMKQLYPGIMPPIVLIGHSMGGAIAVETAKMLPAAVALCVIDVVEGTALESLSSMQSVLRGRPPSFKSIESAIQWSYRGQTHNIEAAKVSMPGQIKNLKTGILAAVECSRGTSQSPEKEPCVSNISGMTVSSSSLETTIEEETDEQIAAGVAGNLKPPLPVSASKLSDRLALDTKMYTWRIDLSRTEHYWNGWFKGLSQKFLDVPVPKILLLANIHGLDTALTVGQMQGKFQLQVLAKSGHAIHEDQPHRVADIIAGFLVKQTLTTAKNDFAPSMPAC